MIVPPGAFIAKDAPGSRTAAPFTLEQPVCLPHHLGICKGSSLNVQTGTQFVLP